ncbi:hypothetical protein AB5I41_11710 [Sphingomonas sp. MMS24-JH45]
MMGVIDTDVQERQQRCRPPAPRPGHRRGHPSPRIERVGDHIEIRAAADPAGEKRKLADLVATLHDVWADMPPDATRGCREPIDIPDRPGLY